MSYRQFVKKFTITMDGYKSESSYLLITGWTGKMFSYFRCILKTICLRTTYNLRNTCQKSNYLS